MGSVKEIMDLVQFIIMLGGVTFAIYFFFSNPDQKASVRLDKIETTCPLKHDQVDYMVVEIKESIKSIEKKMTLIQENDIKHIEQEMRLMSDSVNKILTILEYKDISIKT